MAKSFSGFTSDTAKNLLLDAGAFFVNYDVETDEFESAVTAGKLLGATRGGGSFSAVPEIRSIEIDGLKGKAKGLQVIDSWEVTMSANVLEVTPEVVARALVSSSKTPYGATLFDKVVANNSIELEDYIDNITFVGKQSGYDKPVIIQVYNAINTSGLSLTTTDKGESQITLEFSGHYDATELDTPPFAIFFPTV